MSAPSSKIRSCGVVLAYIVSVLSVLFQAALLTWTSWPQLVLRDAQVDYILHRLHANEEEPTKPFVFVHIPKTGGTTVTAYLMAHFSHECTEIVFSNPRSLAYAQRQGIEFVQNVTRKLDHNAELSNVEAASAVLEYNRPPCLYTHLLAAPDYDERKNMMDLVLKNGTRFKYVIGHVMYGYCMFLEQGCKYVTMLRDPIQRVYSHFRYLQANHPGLIQGYCGAKPCSKFADFVDVITEEGFKGTVDFDNLQTRMIAGDSLWSTLATAQVCLGGISACDATAVGKVGDAMLQRAKENLLRDYTVVGVLDHLGLFKEALEHEHGFVAKKVPMDILNTRSAHKGLRLQDLTARQWQKLNASQAADIELYAFAKQLARSRSRKYMGGKRPEVEAAAVLHDRSVLGAAYADALTFDQD